MKGLVLINADREIKLIDWTQFPFVAIFFAFCEETNINSHQEYRAVYALNKGTADRLNYGIVHDGEMGMNNFYANIIHPPYSEKFVENLILLFDGNFTDGQKDQLRKTKSLPKPTIDQLIRWQKHSLEDETLRFFKYESNENYRVHNQGGLFCFLPEKIRSVEEWVRSHAKSVHHKGILQKFLVPNSDRKEILKALNKMRINYLSLFPDFEGAAKYCNMAIRERDTTLSSIRPY